jgi:Transcriptional regulator
MNKANNARSAATEAKVKAALRTLLAGASLGQIGVAELCRAAGVNRSTFYAHYAGVHEVLAAVEAELFAEAGSLMPPSQDAADLISPKAMEGCLAYVKRNAALYRALMTTDGDYCLVARLSERVKQGYIAPYLGKAGYYAKGELDFQYEFCKAGALSVIRSWLDSGCAQSCRSVAALLSKILRRCLV